MKYLTTLLSLLIIGFNFGQLNYQDVADIQGINYKYGAGNLLGGGLTFVVGAGITFVDFNNDGWDDLSVCTSEGDDILFYENILGTLQPVDLDIIDTSALKQITWVDIDNDGDKDLFTTSLNAGSFLYKNHGNSDLQLEPQSGINTFSMDAFSSAWGDVNNDGFLDVYISIRANDGINSNILYKNNGDFTFTDITASANLFDTLSFSFCGAWFDFNNDGFQDILATTDKYTYPNKLYLNNGDETFTDVSISSGTYDYMDAMSATIADYNYDGHLDFYATNTALGNVFHHNNGDETFTDNAAATGTIFNGIGWGAVFVDGENDGDLDLYVSGMVNPLVPTTSTYYENDGNGSFSQPNNIGFIGDSVASFGNAIGDINNDGYYEIAVCNVDTNLHIWQNGGNSNNWIKINLEGTVSNRDGIGSWIKVYTNGNMQNRYTMMGEGFCSQNSENYIIGVSHNLIIDSIEVTWLSGIVDKLYSIPVNQKIVIEEGMSNKPLIISQNIVHQCAYDTTVIYANEFDNYLWNDGSSADSNLVIGDDYVTLQAWMNFCPHKTEFAQGVISTPSINLGEDSTYCRGDTVSISAGNSWINVLWSDGSTDDSLEISNTGTYWASVSDINGCIATDSILTTFEPCHLSNSTNYKNISISIIPNPSNGIFAIEIDHHFNEASYFIYNNLGKVVHSDKLSSRYNTINISALPLGVYYLNIFDHTYKLIKTN